MINSSSVPSSTSGSSTLTTITRSAATSTQTHLGPASGGFFSDWSTVAGTFALVVVEVVILVFAIFLCVRRWRPRRQTQPQVGRMHLPQDHTQTDLFSADPQGDHTENGLATQEFIKQQSYGEEDIYHETKYPPLARTNAELFDNYRFWDRDTSLHHHPYRTALQPPPYSRDTRIANHSRAIAQSGAYPPSSSWKPLPQVPPMDILSPRTAVLPPHRDRWASATRLGSYGVPVNPGNYAMTSLHQEDGRGRTLVSPMSSSLHTPSPSYPPPIPPKSPLRGVTSTWAIPEVSYQKPGR